MKSHVGWWLFGGAFLSLICSLLIGAWLALPAITGLIFAQPITIVSVPFLDYTDASGQTMSLDWRFGLAILFAIIAAFGALLGFFGWLIFRPRKTRES